MYTQTHTAVKSSGGAQSVSGLVLQRSCACGQHTSNGGECEECKKSRVQRQSSEGGEPSSVPSIVGEVLRSSGQPLDRSTSAFMEARFGQDFSRVRVHSDHRAAESARSVQANAYTVGSSIVFAAGQYAPESSSGRRLLAHELTHVVQQGNNPGLHGEIEIGDPTSSFEAEAERMATTVLDKTNAVTVDNAIPIRRRTAEPMIQRQGLVCDIKPVQDECAGAAAKCHGADDYCRSEFPTSADLANRITSIKANIDASEFGPNAKRNFKHFLDGSGSEVVLPTTLFEGHHSAKDALMTQREKFLEGAKTRIEDGRLKTGAISEVMRWTGHAQGFSLDRSDDLAYAVGGYQLCSNVRVKATNAGENKFKIEFVDWRCQAFDCYNWDPGKGIGLPGLSDKDMCCIENAGKGSHFLDHTEVWDNNVAESRKPEEIAATEPSSTSKPAPSSPAPAAPPKEKEQAKDKEKDRRE